MKTLHSLAAWSALWLAACAAAPPRPASIDDVCGSWQLDAAVPAGARIPTLTIEADGSIRGNAGVNQFRSSLDVAALGQGHWQVAPIAGTRMAGTADAMALERSFLQAIANADSAQIAGDRLQLRNHGAALANFVRPQFVR
jgi:heat shock protein HslJ